MLYKGQIKQGQNLNLTLTTFPILVTVVGVFEYSNTNMHFITVYEYHPKHTFYYFSSTKPKMTFVIIAICLKLSST